MKPVSGPERLVAQMKNMNGNSDGFSIQSVLKNCDTSLLLQFSPFKKFITDLSSAAGLKRNGEFYFNFPETGFVGIVCFQGSHVSLRSSPVDGIATFDLFLSDRLLNNLNLSEQIYRDTVAFFRSEVMKESYLSL